MNPRIVHNIEEVSYSIDKVFGDGYARKNPQLVGQLYLAETQRTELSALDKINDTLVDICREYSHADTRGIDFYADDIASALKELGKAQMASTFTEMLKAFNEKKISINDYDALNSLTK